MEVRLFAFFRRGRCKKRTMDLPDNTRLCDLLENLQISEQDVSLPLVNGLYSPLDQQLLVNDVVSLFPPVAGG